MVTDHTELRSAGSEVHAGVYEESYLGYNKV
jgi:hypothetical protein